MLFFFLNSAEYCSTILAASSILLVLQGKRNFQSFTLTTITSNKERIQFHCLPSKKEKTSFGLPHSHSVKKKEHAKQFDIHFTKIKKKKRPKNEVTSSVSLLRSVSSYIRLSPVKSHHLLKTDIEQILAFPLLHSKNRRHL